MHWHLVTRPKSGPANNMFLRPKLSATGRILSWLGGHSAYYTPVLIGGSRSCGTWRRSARTAQKRRVSALWHSCSITGLL